MKIKSVTANNRKKCFEVSIGKKLYTYPYAKLNSAPSLKNRLVHVFVDPELAREAFTYRLESGDEDSIHIEQVLAFNEDPTHLTEELIYRLTLLLQEQLANSELSKRQLARLLKTSQAQLERMLDQTNYKKSIRQIIHALHLLDCRIDFVAVGDRKRAA